MYNVKVKQSSGTLVCLTAEQKLPNQITLIHECPLKVLIVSVSLLVLSAIIYYKFCHN